VAFVLAGHNGSGKSTLWYSRLAESLRMPLVNADRMMMSILPDADPLTGASRRGPNACATMTSGGRRCRRKACAPSRAW